MTETESGDLQQKNSAHLRALDRAEGKYTASSREGDPQGTSHLENAYEPDIAAQIDTLAERFAEHFQVPLKTAEAFLAWHEAEVQRITLERLMEVLSQIAGVLMWKCKNTSAREWHTAIMACET
jgi:hypothetical protein